MSYRPTHRYKTSNWRKIHIAVDEQTLEIRAVEVTSSAIGDALVLPDLLNQIAPQEEITCVTADGAYDTRACHYAIAARGAAAIILPRKNARLWKPTTDGAKARNDTLRTSKRLERALWRKWIGYYRRSRVEAKMNCIKQLGKRLMAKAFDRQVAEFRSALPSSTASPRAEALSRKTWVKSIWRKGNLRGGRTNLDQFAAQLSSSMGFMSGGGFQVLTGGIIGLGWRQQAV